MNCIGCSGFSIWMIFVDRVEIRIVGVVGGESGEVVMNIFVRCLYNIVGER